MPHCCFGGLRSLMLQRPPWNKCPGGNISSLSFHYLWEIPGCLYTQAAERCSGHGVGVLEASATLNILFFCGRSNKSQSRMEEEKPLDNIPEVRLVHANVWCLYPTSLSFAFCGWKQFYSQTSIQVNLHMWEVPFTCSIYPVLSAYAVLTSVRLSSSFTQEPDKSLFCEVARSADRQKLFWI